METRRFSGTVLFLCLTIVATDGVRAGDANPSPPTLYTPVLGTNGQNKISWSPYPAAEQYSILSTPDVATPLAPNGNGTVSGYDWLGPLSGPAGFYNLRVTTLSSNALLAATVLNRLTYGPTPDDLQHINDIGVQPFIDEQRHWEDLAEDLDGAPPIVNTPIVVPPPPPLTNWIRASATGTATATNFGIYLSASGSVYLDDIRLVYGTNADNGANLLVNGDFEDPVLTNGWFIGTSINGTRSVITNSPTTDGNAASGTNCLLLVESSGTTTLTAGLWQPFTNGTPVSTQKFTLSFSYLPVRQSSSNVTLTVRLSGSLTVTNVRLPDPPPTPLTPPPAPTAISPIYAKLTNCAPPMPGYGSPPTNVSLTDLRAYHILHAIQSKKQLYEILVQFFENHFSTQYQKTEDWFDNNYANAITNDNTRKNLAVDLHWREQSRWRQKLLDPNCTFLDLLKISIESPAMIIYLDTVLNTRSAPNENYAREILELHTMGADNGYIQQDIVEMARIWTGWAVAKKDVSVADNPFAAPVGNITNDPGIWVLHFKTNIHSTSAKSLFATNTVIDPRFGPFRGGQSYAFRINANAYPGTNGITEGYLIATNLANLPQTMEFISVKLCRTFVHENFDFGVYDYNNPSSPEAQLVKDCMTAWDTPAGDGRKGNIRSVIRAIFESDLFRGHAASRQKIKTPLELAVSAVRALRFLTSETNNWVGVTGETDGNAIISPLSRMGGMNLFDKPEPNGYSEFGRIWLNTANLCERMRFVQHLLMPTSSSLKGTDYGSGGTRNISDPVKLIKWKLPQNSWSDAGAIVDYFLALFFPGEGKANLDLDRTAAIAFLNTDQSGAASVFANLGNTSAAYDGRIRGMVGLLMSLPRFQEQ